MRHLNVGRKLSRGSSHRRATLRNLVTSLLMKERITTTDAKAKELRRYAERMITLGKQKTLAARRRARRFVMTDEALSKLFSEVAPRFQGRAGGYTRVIKVGTRRGDCAPLSMVELTELGVTTVGPRAGAKRAEKAPKG